MKNGRLQAKDIGDRALLGAVRDLAAIKPYGPQWAMLRDLENAFASVPQKVLLAKCSALIARGLLQGCTCGCRGDFELTSAGRRLLTCPSPDEAVAQSYTEKHPARPRQLT